MKALVLFVLAALSFQTAIAQEINAVSEIGDHYSLFTFEKNENPENILILYTKLDNNCQVMEEAGAPVFDMYWMMNRQRYKPTNSLIKSGIKDRLQLQAANGANGFYVVLNDLKEVKSDLKDAKLSVIAEKHQGKCRLRSLFTLGPSDNNATIQIQSIYSEATKTLVPPFRKLKSVTLNGINVLTGAKVSRTYPAK